MTRTAPDSASTGSPQASDPPAAGEPPQAPRETSIRTAGQASSETSQAARGRAIVVGASSGMGAALCRRLAADGWHVAALARSTHKLAELEAQAAAVDGRVLARAHDVHDVASVPALWEELVRELGGLDMLIYAAGAMPEIGPKEYSTEKDLELIDVNLTGCIAWCNEAARFFGSQRSGKIVGISSVAGDRGRKGNPVYCTTKAAMNTYLEALRNRLGDLGVSVTTIKPGFVDTQMTQGMEGLFWLISADEAAKQILSAARWRANERYVPRRWWFVMTAIKSIPSFVFRRLNV